jgi:hypothetical protein
MLTILKNIICTALSTHASDITVRTATYLFSSHQGVKQGEPLSPIMFLLFINYSTIRMGDTYKLVSFDDLFALLYADDTVLFAVTRCTGILL